jgi:tRNA(Ile)-lysidine synthase
MLLLASAMGREVVVWHVDHQLRTTSADDAAYVMDVAKSLGVACNVVVIDLEEGPNLEARARALRRAVLPTDVAYGHTTDDQLETYLINLMRGSGLDGWVALSPGAQHPILGLRRTETHLVCEQAGVTPIVDSMNDDARFVRVRVRNEIVPLLDDIASRDVAAVFGRQAPLIADDVLYLNDAASQLDPTDTRAMQKTPRALVRRALRRWLISSDGYAPDADAIERVMAVVDHDIKATEVAGVGRVTRRDRRLSIEPIDR